MQLMNRVMMCFDSLNFFSNVIHVVMCELIDSARALCAANRLHLCDPIPSHSDHHVVCTDLLLDILHFFGANRVTIYPLERRYHYLD